MSQVVGVYDDQYIGLHNDQALEGHWLDPSEKTFHGQIARLWQQQQTTLERVEQIRLEPDHRASCADVNESVLSSTKQLDIRPQSHICSSLESDTSGPQSKTDDERWQAVLTRDSLAAHSCFYLVQSTRIFCRPTCPSRRPQRSGITFVSTPMEARQKGYRACKRCRPEETQSSAEVRQGAAISAAQDLLICRTVNGGTICLDELARTVGMSKFYFHRVFRKEMGLTPAQYARSLRQGGDCQGTKI